MTFSLQDLQNLARIPRLTLINAITGFKSGNLVGSVGADGVPNLAIFSSAVHIGSAPPLLGIVTRPIDGDLKTTRHTYQNIQHSRFFTLNHVHENMVTAAHQTSASYPDGVSEFDAVGLTPQWNEGIAAPYVAEATIKMGLEYVEEYFIKANNTILIIGKVLELILPDDCLDEQGNLDLQRAGTVALSGLDTYHRTEPIVRLPYARV
ncbi:flavin reductase family protein [Haliscomenobacter hydrossis]|uniref:Flavin reductase domain protein FMN-binding protein n=1 Tax=Haliscomenobacter hydrossis (strain ATCC 27775 / DSM 1100 / LMG 10767 / O) TaxID=760192 RepID=F4L7D5_HALH1|nr:flavin reductase [Haliscomenobacter hydrossis]AEE53162.1 flavin reductase domain protein FMN-binding protein [Haliscomenobacter hydrossis DSM 1100]